MSTIKLPESSFPEWTKYISDEKWIPKIVFQEKEA